MCVHVCGVVYSVTHRVVSVVINISTLQEFKSLPSVIADQLSVLGTEYHAVTLGINCVVLL